MKEELHLKKEGAGEVQLVIQNSPAEWIQNKKK